jgi:hypothetical protein
MIFLQFFLLLSLVEILKEHMIFNKVFNHKQVKMKRWKTQATKKPLMPLPPPPRKKKPRPIMNAC